MDRYRGHHLSCWMLSRFMNLIQVKGSSCAWNNYTSFFYYSMPIFSALPISLTLLLQDVTILIQPIHIVTAHPRQGKPKKIKPKLRMCIFQQRSGGKWSLHLSNRFLHGTQEGIGKTPQRKASKKGWKKLSFQPNMIKYTPSQTERRESLTYMILQQSKTQHKPEWENTTWESRLRSSSRLCHQPRCQSLEKIYSLGPPASLSIKWGTLTSWWEWRPELEGASAFDLLVFFF